MKTKPILVISASIIIGIITGFVISAQITRKKIDNMVKLGMEEGFRHRVIYVIDPSDDQLLQIQPIIDKYAKSNSELTREFGGKLKNEMNAFYKELSPFLTDSQKERLKRIESHRRKYMRKKFRHGSRGKMPCVRDPHKYGWGKNNLDILFPPMPGCPPQDSFWIKLNLTPSQIKKLEKHKTWFLNEKDSLFNSIDDPDSIPYAIRKLMIRSRHDIMKILDQEQRKIYRKELGIDE